MWTLLLALCAAQDPTLVVRDVTLIPMTGAVPALADQAVAVRGGVVTWIGPSAAAPAGAERVVEGRGRFLVPGLIDAHVHLLDETQLALYVAHGVTTVLNMSGTPRVLAWREQVAAGERLGPRLFSTGPQVKEQGVLPFDTEVTVPRGEQVAEFVAMHRELGYDFLKIWSSLPPYLYEPILAECRRQGVRVTGHIPSRVGLRGALASGQRSFAHVEELLNKFFVRELERPGFEALRGVVADEHPTFVSTLVTYEMIADTMDDARLAARLARPGNDVLDPFLLQLWASEQNDWWKLRRRDPGDYYDRALGFLVAVTGELHRAGVPVLAGSDAGLVLANVIPGSSLHRELTHLVRAGLTPHEALAAATARTGEFLAPGSMLGTLQVGAPADMLLLGADPLESIGNTGAIEAVVLGGELLERRDLDGLLARTAALQEPAHAFLERWRADGLPAAVAAVRAARAAGEPPPGEAGLIVGAYHRAAAEDLDEAVVLAQLACELYPASYLPAYFLAGVLEMRGDGAAARRTLEHALELCPTHPMIPPRLAAGGR